MTLGRSLALTAAAAVVGTLVGLAIAQRIRRREATAKGSAGWWE